METRASWKDEELEDERRTYYSREAKGGGGGCQRGTFGDGVNDGERRLRRDEERERGD